MRRLNLGMATMGLISTLLLAVAGAASAGTVLIDFEQYSDGQNLHGMDLGGVTLTNPSGKIEVYDDRFGVGYHSGTKSIASSTGLDSVNPLVGVFDDPVTSVSLWGGDEGWSPTEIDSWDLIAYDAKVGGNQVGRVGSGSWDGGPYRELSVSGSSILRFEAYWTGPNFGIGYDDLQFVTIPPPPPPPPAPSGSGGSGTMMAGGTFTISGGYNLTMSGDLGSLTMSGGATTQGATLKIDNSVFYIDLNRAFDIDNNVFGGHGKLLIGSTSSSKSVRIKGPTDVDTPFSSQFMGENTVQFANVEVEQPIGGNLTVALEDGFVPGLDDRFEILPLYAVGSDSDRGGLYGGWFDDVMLDPAWPSPQQWGWEFQYKDGGTGLGSQPEPGRPFYSASLRLVPEPSTLALLVVGALALGIGWRRGKDEG